MSERVSPPRPDRRPVVLAEILSWRVRTILILCGAVGGAGVAALAGASDYILIGLAPMGGALIACLVPVWVVAWRRSNTL
jgi:hypothetical protein